MNISSDRIQAFASVAMSYYPDETKTNATRKLRNHIKRNKRLYEELSLLGYENTTTELAPRMVQTINWYCMALEEEELNKMLRESVKKEDGKTE